MIENKKCIDKKRNGRKTGKKINTKNINARKSKNIGANNVCIIIIPLLFYVNVFRF